MSTQASDIITQRITQLVLKHPFFSTCILNLDVRPGPVGTACTDGTHLIYDPAFIDTLSKETVSGLLAHEIMHCVLLHPFRLRKGYHDPQLANIAMDYEINGYLDTYNREYASSKGGDAPLPLPAGGLIDHKYDGMAWEQIYELLAREQQQQQQQSGNGDGDGSPGNSKGKGNGKDKDKGNAPSPGDFGKVESPGSLTPESGDGDGDGAASGQPTKQLSEMDWQAITAKAESVARMMGTMPGDFSSKLGKLRRPEVGWETYIQRYFDARAEDDYDTRRSDRRFVPADIYLPTLGSDAMGEVVFGIDTSGSVYGDLFQRFMSEVDDVLVRFRPSRTIILQCDTRITDVREYRPGDRIGVDFQMKGGGGTDFRPIFNWVEQQGITPKVLVLFTDGYGTFPKSIPGYDVLAVDYGGGGASYPGTFEVIHIKP